MENIRKELIRQKRSNEEILKSLDEKELSRSEYLDKVEIEGIIKGLNIALGVLEKCRWKSHSKEVLDMKLYELLNVVISDYMIGVNKGTEFIEEFDSSNIQKRTKYRESLVTSVHILNEETIAINVEISWWNSHSTGYQSGDSRLTTNNYVVDT